MSKSAEAVSAVELSTCSRCGRLYEPPHTRGCWPCRRITKPRPRLVETCIDQLERESEAEAATYYFLESFHGHPDNA
jgi:hypothetical protein